MIPPIRWRGRRLPTPHKTPRVRIKAQIRNVEFSEAATCSAPAVGGQPAPLKRCKLLEPQLRCHNIGPTLRSQQCGEVLAGDDKVDNARPDESVAKNESLADEAECSGLAEGALAENRHWLRRALRISRGSGRPLMVLGKVRDYFSRLVRKLR